MMLPDLKPIYLLIGGFALLVIGFALPLLMIMRYLPSTFALNFIAYACSFLGLMLGLVGSISIVVRNRKK